MKSRKSFLIYLKLQDDKKKQFLRHGDVPTLLDNRNVDTYWRRNNYDNKTEKSMMEIAREAPLGLQYLSSVLETIGIKAEILDQRLLNFDREWLLKKIKTDMPFFIGFYVCSDALQTQKVAAYISYIKQEVNIPIIAGGPPFNIEKIINAGCDIVCSGEGEKTIQDIVRWLDDKITIDEIDGISYCRNGKIQSAASHYLIDNLDSVPFPSRDKKTINDYYNYGILNIRQPHIPLIASRGCPMRCSFCTSHFHWQHKVRFRSPENVIEEIDMLFKDYDARFLSFRDDIFGIKDEWLELFCNRLIGRHYSIHWVCDLHPFSFPQRTEYYFSLLRKAGCNTVHFGLQAAHPSILKNINRNECEPEFLLERIKTAKRNNILVHVTFIFGLPGETEETLATTIKYIRSAKPHYIQIFSLGILEKSEISEKYRNKPISDMSQEQINKWIIKGRKTFYFNPFTIISLILYVLRNNPRWFFIAAKFFNQGLFMIGIRREDNFF